MKLPFLLSIRKFFFFLGTIWAKEKVECLRCQLSACIFFFYSHTHKYSDFRSSLPSLEVIALHYRIDFQCKFYWINMKMEKCLTSPCHTQFSSVQSLSHVWLFGTPWTAARQAFLSITSSRSPLKLMSIESVMPSNHLILCHPLLLLPSIFPASGAFPMSHFFASGIGVSTSASVLPMNIQDWFPLGWTCWISLQSKGLSRVLSNIIVQKHQFFGAQLSLYTNFHIHRWLLEKL